MGSYEQDMLERAIEDGDYNGVYHLMVDPTIVNAPYKSHDRWTPLMFAAYYGDYDITQLLLEHDAFVNQPSTDGRIPLTIAVEQNHCAVAGLLMDAGSNANKRDTSGRTPITKAIIAGNYQMFTILSSHDETDIHQPDRHGDSPLMLACWYGYAAIAQDLLNSGVDVNAMHNNETALLCAARQSRQECVKLLLRHGADPRITDSRGYNALRHAFEANPRNHNILNMIRQRLRLLGAPDAPSNNNNNDNNTTSRPGSGIASQNPGPAPRQAAEAAPVYAGFIGTVVMHPSAPQQHNNNNTVNRSRNGSIMAVQEPAPARTQVAAAARTSFVHPPQQQQSTSSSDAAATPSIHETKCIACMINNPCMVFPLCGHLYLCEKCALNVGNRCPGCRSEGIPIKVHLP
jgi:ankyrin repeat protein